MILLGLPLVCSVTISSLGICYKLENDSIVLINWLRSLAFLSNTGTLSIISLETSGLLCVILSGLLTSVLETDDANEACELVSWSLLLCLGTLKLVNRFAYLEFIWSNSLSLSFDFLHVSVCLFHSILTWSSGMFLLSTWQADVMVLSSLFTVMNCSAVMSLFNGLHFRNT